MTKTFLLLTCAACTALMACQTRFSHSSSTDYIGMPLQPVLAMAQDNGFACLDPADASEQALCFKEDKCATVTRIIDVDTQSMQVKAISESFFYQPGRCSAQTSHASGAFK